MSQSDWLHDQLYRRRLLPGRRGGCPCARSYGSSVEGRSAVRRSRWSRPSIIVARATDRALPRCARGPRLRPDRRDRYAM